MSEPLTVYHAIVTLLTQADATTDPLRRQAVELLADLVDPKHITPITNVMKVGPGESRILYTTIDIGEDDVTDRGNTGIRRERIQFDFVAPTTLEARRMSDLAHVVLGNLTAVVDTIRIDWTRFVGGSMGRGEQAPGSNTAPARVRRDLIITFRQPPVIPQE